MIMIVKTPESQMGSPAAASFWQKFSQTELFSEKWTVLRKMDFSRENQTKAGYSVCFAYLFLPAGHKEN